MKFGPKLQYSSLWDAILKNFPSIALNEFDSIDPQSCFISNNSYTFKYIHIEESSCELKCITLCTSLPITQRERAWIGIQIIFISTFSISNCRVGFFASPEENQPALVSLISKWTGLAKLQNFCNKWIDTECLVPNLIYIYYIFLQKTKYQQIHISINVFSI